MKKYIFFDLDGTLTDSKPGIVNSFNYCLSKFGISKSESEIEQFIGPPLTQTFLDGFGFDDEKCDIAVSYFREYCDTKGFLENSVYEGIVPLLEKLKENGAILIVATSKPEGLALKVLEHFDLKKYFAVICGGCNDERFNSKSSIISTAIRKAGLENVSKSQMIMVGDRKHDIIGAFDNGIESCGVLYGYGTESELLKYGATYIVNTVKDLSSLLMN